MTTTDDLNERRSHIHSDDADLMSTALDERRPLLSRHHEVSTHASNSSVTLGNDANSSSREIWIEELKILAKYTAPIFGAQLLEQSLTMTSVISIGHLSTTDLAGATLGFMTCNVTGFSIILGLVSALDSLLPQSWTSKPDLVGLWSMRMGLVIAILIVPILAVWFTIEPVLLALKQEPEVAHLASTYLRWVSLGLPAYGGNAVSKRYLQSQGLMHIQQSYL